MQTTEIKRRLKFTKQQKINILDELSMSNLTVTQFAETKGVHPVTIHQWKRKMASRDQSSNPNEDVKEILSEVEALKFENENLKKALADMAVENQISKAYNQVLKKKVQGTTVQEAKEVISLLKPNNISKGKICKFLKICRQSIYWKSPRTKMIKDRYRMASDEAVLEEIKQEKKDRPTYGYKRITAMVNRTRASKGLDKYNRKRIERVMNMNGLLQLKTPVVRSHEKTGKIITLHSNTRWCSDGFEIICFNGEKVYVAFSLDCHDRYAIDIVARKRPLLAEDIQDLMMRVFLNDSTQHKLQE